MALSPDDIARLAQELAAMAERPAIPLDRFEREMLDYYKARDRAPATIAKLRQAIREIRALPGVSTTRDLTFETIVRFIVSRAGRHSITTISLLSSVRATCSFAVDMGYLHASPFTGRRNKLFPRRGSPKRQKRHHARQEIARVLRLLRAEAESAPGEHAAWKGWRLHALFAVLVYTGLRKQEALRLQVRDVDLFGRMLKVVPRHRLKTEESAAPVPMPPDLVPILAAWLPRAGPTWVFPGATRVGPWTGGPPGQTALDQLKAAALRAGVHGMTCQSCRHSLATHARHFGLNRGQIRALLRHTDDRTQEHYLEDDLDNLRESVRPISYAG